MAINKLNKPIMWLITISSKHDLSDRDRDLIAEHVSEEARKAKEPYNFILHDIVESKIYSKILIEGEKDALENLLTVLKVNLPYKIGFRKRMP